RRAQGLLDTGFGQAPDIDTQLLSQPTQDVLIRGIAAGCPQRLENGSDRVQRHTSGEAQAQVWQRIKWMRSREAKRDALALRVPDAGTIGPYTLRRDLRRALLAPMIE